MKKVIAGFALASTLAIPGIALAAPSLADPGKADPNTPASSSGATHGAFADVNGNFGFLGPAGGTPGYHGGAVGQDSGATGYNNSHVSEPPTITHK